MTHKPKDERSELRQEFLSALDSGADERELVSIVEKHKEKRLSQKDAYAALEKLYFELGCGGDQYDRDPEYCDRVGDVLDRVWGWKGRIWPRNMGDPPT